MDVFTDRDRLVRMTVYPGMDPAESRVLRQFIRRRGEQFVEWRFNVRLGAGEEPPADVDAATRAAWRELTKARTDCVAMRGPTSATIIEAKDVWGNDAVWQLRGYRDLYLETFPSHRVDLVGVARDASSTARKLAASSEITLYVYDLPPALPDVDETAIEDATNGQ